MRRIPAILLLLMFWTRALGDQIVLKHPLRIAGKSYEYSDVQTVLVGWSSPKPPSRVHTHFIVIHEDQNAYLDVRVWRGDHDGIPYVSIGSVDVVLPKDGMYVLKQIGGRMRLCWVASEIPMPDSADEVQIEQWIASALGSGRIVPRSTE